MELTTSALVSLLNGLVDLPVAAVEHLHHFDVLLEQVQVGHLLLVLSLLLLQNPVLLVDDVPMLG